MVWSGPGHGPLQLGRLTSIPQVDAGRLSYARDSNSAVDSANSTISAAYLYIGRMARMAGWQCALAAADVVNHRTPLSVSYAGNRKHP